MLIRFVVDNVFSFGEQKEFTTISDRRLKTLQHHKYKLNDFSILKILSIYGANGAGKSNLIEALWLLQKLVVEEKVPSKLKHSKFKFNEEDSNNQILAIEFIQENKAFYYGVVLNKDNVKTEELYLSGLGKHPDILIYERKTDDDGKTRITFLDEFEKDEKSQVLKSVLVEDFVKSNESILKLLSKRDNKYLEDVKKAFNWFNDTLQIITPNSKPLNLIQLISTDENFKNYAKDLMCSLNIGINELSSVKKDIREFHEKGNENEIDNLIKKVEQSPTKMINASDGLLIVKEDEKFWVKNLGVGHVGKKNKTVFLGLNEESAGTIRLLDFVPVFKDIIEHPKVFVIDEIERSIHPLLIKELVKKFSLDDKTKGQLIFSTHEANLLDQKIFRQDEIWFAEKNKNGSTDLYSLSDFKEHKTIDIRKGYLSGRYGSIPFLGNLQDLNWHDYDTDE